MKCPKCGYVRLPAEQAPEWQCPKCGIAYSKFSDNTGVALSDRREAVPRASENTRTGPNRFRNIRIAALLLLLFLVASDAWLTQVRTTSWERPLWVVVYPIAADGSAEVANYIATLHTANYSSIDSYFNAQARRYGVSLEQPVAMHVGPVVREMPPLPPREANALDAIVWSLKLRYWAWKFDDYDGPRPDIRVFALYHRAEPNKRLAHSTGLQKGMVSVVNVFALKDVAEGNNMVIAHELLHTLGATDKYDFATKQPLFPQGFADPALVPRYPQRQAEIMGGYIPLSPTWSEQPDSLADTLVGEQTALEIGWQK